MQDNCFKLSIMARAIILRAINYRSEVSYDFRKLTGSFSLFEVSGGKGKKET